MIDKMLLMPGWLAIHPALTETKTSVGMELPAESVDQPPCGEVVAVGERFANLEEANKIKQTFNIEVGDTVYFQKWGGIPMKIEGKLYLFLKYSDLVSVIKK